MIDYLKTLRDKGMSEKEIKELFDNSMKELAEYQKEREAAEIAEKLFDFICDYYPDLADYFSTVDIGKYAVSFFDYINDYLESVQEALAELVPEDGIKIEPISANTNGEITFSDHLHSYLNND